MKDVAIVTLTAAAPGELHYRLWAGLLPDLTLSDGDCHRLVDALIRHLEPGILELGTVLALLDELRPTSSQETAIVDWLIDKVAENTAFTAAQTARILLERPLTTEQQNAIVEALMEHVTKAKPADLVFLLNAAAAFPLTSDDRSIVTARAVQLLETSNSEGRLSEARIPQAVTAFLAIGGMNNDVKERALDLALAEIARVGSIDAPLAALLPRLGFGIDALKGFAHRYRERQNVEHVLRELASVLRHNCDPASWKISLGQLADCHPPLY